MFSPFVAYPSERRRPHEQTHTLACILPLTAAVFSPKMFCLRRFAPRLLSPMGPALTKASSSWFPLLFIPTNASPLFILLFFVCTYFLNRPCIYCSFLLLILFVSSCQWGNRCFFDFNINSNFFSPSSPSSLDLARLNSSSAQDVIEDAFVWAGAINSTTLSLAGAVAQDVKSRLPGTAEWTGLGVGWLRSLLGRREWRLPCMDVYIRL